MRLAELRPNFYRSVAYPKKGYLTFDCPVCPSQEKHRFTIATFDGEVRFGDNDAKRWALSGSPPEWGSVSLSPSIALLERCCWHGSVANGEVA